MFDHVLSDVPFADVQEQDVALYIFPPSHLYLLKMAAHPFYFMDILDMNLIFALEWVNNEVPDVILGKKYTRVIISLK